MYTGSLLSDGEFNRALLWLPLMLAVLNKGAPRVSDSESPTVFSFFFTGDVFFQASQTGGAYRLGRRQPIALVEAQRVSPGYRIPM